MFLPTLISSQTIRDFKSFSCLAEQTQNPRGDKTLFLAVLLGVVVVMNSRERKKELSMLQNNAGTK